MKLYHESERDFIGPYRKFWYELSNGRKPSDFLCSLLVFLCILHLFLGHRVQTSRRAPTRVFLFASSERVLRTRPEKEATQEGELPMKKQTFKEDVSAFMVGTSSLQPFLNLNYSKTFREVNSISRDYFQVPLFITSRVYIHANGGWCEKNFFFFLFFFCFFNFIFNFVYKVFCLKNLPEKNKEFFSVSRNNSINFRAFTLHSLSLSTYHTLSN